jgi:hypothetical protein
MYSVTADKEQAKTSNNQAKSDKTTFLMSLPVGHLPYLDITHHRLMV